MRDLFPLKNKENWRLLELTMHIESLKSINCLLMLKPILMVQYIHYPANNITNPFGSPRKEFVLFSAVRRLSNGFAPFETQLRLEMHLVTRRFGCESIEISMRNGDIDRNE